MLFEEEISTLKGRIFFIGVLALLSSISSCSSCLKIDRLEKKLTSSSGIITGNVIGDYPAEEFYDFGNGRAYISVNGVNVEEYFFKNYSKNEN